RSRHFVLFARDLLVGGVDRWSNGKRTHIEMDERRNSLHSCPCPWPRSLRRTTWGAIQSCIDSGLDLLWLYPGAHLSFAAGICVGIIACPAGERLGYGLRVFWRVLA